MPINTLNTKGIASRVQLEIEGALMVCMNFVEGGICHATGQRCLLGAVYQPNQLCDLQGSFDVWITQDDNILLSDMGPPSPEPKRSVALGVEKELAIRIAQKTAGKMLCKIFTSQQICHQCGRSYWISQHELEGSPRLGRRHFCPKCIPTTDEKTAKILNFWCG